MTSQTGGIIHTIIFLALLEEINIKEYCPLVSSSHMERKYHFCHTRAMMTFSIELQFPGWQVGVEQQRHPLDPRLLHHRLLRHPGQLSRYASAKAAATTFVAMSVATSVSNNNEMNGRTRRSFVLSLKYYFQTLHNFSKQLKEGTFKSIPGL